MDKQHREGVGGFRKLDPEQGPVYHAQRVSRSTGLGDLSRHYAFFSHALLFIRGGMEHDPISDYIATRDQKLHPFHIELPRPVFAGLGVHNGIDWDHRLLMCSRDGWEPLRRFLMETGAVDRTKKTFFRTMAQDIAVADVLQLDKMTTVPARCPFVRVTVFGVDATFGQVGFLPSAQLLFQSPRVVEMPARAETIKFGNAILSEHEKPYQAIEPSHEQAFNDMISKKEPQDENPIPPAEGVGSEG